MSDKPKKILFTDVELSEDKITSFIHNMKEGETIRLDSRIEITLQETRFNRSTLRIRAPKSVPILRQKKTP